MNFDASTWHDSVHCEAIVSRAVNGMAQLPCITSSALSMGFDAVRDKALGGPYRC